MTGVDDGTRVQTLVAKLPRREIVTPETIYGTILFCAILAAAPDEDNDAHLLVEGMVASVAIWFAHVVAVTMARHGRDEETVVGVGRALRQALSHSTGILIGPILPILVLALGAGNLIDDFVGYVAALSMGVALLVAFGVISCIERHARWYACVAGGLLTGCAGVVAITLKAAFGA